MKYWRMVMVSLLLLLLVSSAVAANKPAPLTVLAPSDTEIAYNTLYASAHTDLWQIDPYTGSFTFIGPIGYEGTDIAFDGETLYGVNFSQLLSLDPTTGAGAVIGSIGYGDVNALTVGPDGTMYAGTVSGALLTIDKTTGAGTLIGYYGPGLGSSGDLAIRFDGLMFASIRVSGMITDWLARIDTRTGRAIPIGDIGESAVYGLDFKDWSLYGVTANGLLLEIDTETGAGSRIETKDANFWGLSTSGPALQGKITAPSDNFTTAPATIAIEATAAYPGGQRVNQVEFYVYYDRYWHALGSDLVEPYTRGWETPTTLFSQQALLRIDVVGTDLQDQLERASYAGGVRRVNIIESMGDPNVSEMWVPTRAYLNQRSLSPDGDSKCNVSSIAMILAMDGHISSDYLTMANTANGLAHYLLPNPGVEKECEALRDPVPSAYCSGAKTRAEAWDILKSLIDAGHPVIVDSRPGAATSAGHYIVAIGYKEANGTDYLIAYDPYGEWGGSLNSYFRNATLPASHVGKWVFYEYDAFTGSSVYLFATVSPPPETETPDRLLAPDAVSLTAPDQISDEPRIGVIFDGLRTSYVQFMPLLDK